MNSERVHFVVSLTIHEGKFEGFAAVAKVMIEGTAKEPGARAYEWYLSSDRSRCRLFETYANAGAMREHMEGPVVKEVLPKLLAFATISGFEVYGMPDAQSAEALRSAGAEIYSHWEGLPERQATGASGGSD
jgi:quinol monooxygenase YgiN